MSRVLPPSFLDLGGERWEVNRAWPGSDRMPVELRRGDRVRGGYWDGSRFGVLLPGTDERLPSLDAVCRLGEARGVVVSHRPGRRAVVRGADGAYRKVVRPGRAARILDGVARAAAFDGPFRTPAVLEHDDDVVTFAALPGRSLHDAAAWNAAGWDRAWDETLTAWTDAVTRHAPDLLEPLHDAQAEARVLRDWMTRAEPYGPPSPGWRDACEQAIDGLLRLGPTPGGFTPIHRDLHDKQLLWHAADGPGMLDVDTACAGDPAVDLGNLRAHARWRSIQGRWTPAHGAVVIRHLDAAAARLGCPLERVIVFQEAAAARLSCVYAVRPRWRRRVAALVASERAHHEAAS